MSCLRAWQHIKINDVLAHFAVQLARVDRSGECWRWPGWLTGNGYGFLRLGQKGRMHLAHRLAWEAANGSPAPDKLVILHTCDHRDCVRNDEPGTYLVNGVLRPRWGHLVLGTQQENLRDMVVKGRTQRGARRGLPPLTADDVRAIRALGQTGMRQVDIGERFGIDQPRVSAILRRRIWWDVE